MSARVDLMSQYGRAEDAPLGTLTQFRLKLDAYRAEVLAEDGQAYDGELTMLRGLVATLNAVAKHGDLSDVQKLLAEHATDDAAARAADANPAFFRPGRTYAKGQDGYKAPEQTWQFRCIATADHPRDGAGRRAFGFMRQGIGPWESVGVREGEFERGWVDVTEGGAADA